jgi:hypothetical protein
VKKIYLCIIQLLLLSTLLFYTKKTVAQSQAVAYGRGAVPIPDSLYQKLPKVNWGAFRKYAPNLPDTCKGQFFLL